MCRTSFERIILRCLRKDPAKRFQVHDRSRRRARGDQSTRPGPDCAAPQSAGPDARAAIAARCRRPSPPAAGGSGRDRADPAADGHRQPDVHPWRRALPERVARRQAGRLCVERSQRRQHDIYIKPPGADTALRLTSHPAEDSVPAWSPDGSRIAFVRREGTQAAVYLTPPAPGAERKLVDLRSPTTHIGRMSVSWTPDGQLARDGRRRRAVALPVAGRRAAPTARAAGLTRRLLLPGRGAERQADSGTCCAPASIPATSTSSTSTADFSVRGEPRRLTHHAPNCRGWPGRPTNARSSTARCSAAARGCGASAASGGTPERVELAAVAEFPAVSAAGQQAARSPAAGGDVDLWKFEDGMGPVSMLSSTTTDFNPQLSPDGRKAAFVTPLGSRRRSGSRRSTAQRGGDHQATGRGQGSPRWSPDGRWIAYDAQAEDGNWDIYVIEAAGGQPRRLTTHPAFEHFASWSRDGQWIYFRSATHRPERDLADGRERAATRCK